MKKQILLTILMLSTSIITFSQITFERDTTYASGTVYTGQTLEMNNYGVNNFSTRKTFGWTVEVLTTPSAWENALCTLPGLCYSVYLGYTDSFVLEKDSQILMRFDYSPRNVCGSGFAKVVVYPKDDVRDKKTLYFSGDAYCASIADQKESDALIQLYPNPASSTINITSPIENATLTLYATSGGSMDQVVIENAKNFSYDISSLSSGNYFIVLFDSKNQKSYVKEFSKN